jgi:hypothetical protein
LRGEGDAVASAVWLEGKLQLSVAPYRDHFAFLVLVLEFHGIQMRSPDLALQAKFLRNYGQKNVEGFGQRQVEFKLPDVLTRYGCFHRNFGGISRTHLPSCFTNPLPRH